MIPGEVNEGSGRRWRPSADVAERPSVAYFSSLYRRIFEFFKIRAVETSIQGTAVSVRKVHHGDWLGEYAQQTFA